MASGTSAWRGYEYYESRKVESYAKVSDTEYSGTVKGSEDKVYNVYIDIAHPRKSRCNCPFADGRRVICKHQVALYFTIFPKEADRYNRELEEQEAEQEACEAEERKQTEACVNKMTKAELRAELLSILESYDEVYSDFVLEHNLW